MSGRQKFRACLAAWAFRFCPRRAASLAGPKRASKTSAEKFSVTSGKEFRIVMSRIGKMPVVIPPKVKVEVKGRRVCVEGPKGKLDFEMPRRANAKVEKDQILVTRDGDDAEAKAMHGLTRALVNN